MIDESQATIPTVSEDERVNESVLRGYLRKIEKAYQTGNATEHTYRAALQELLEALFPGSTVTNEPKRIKCGAPDLIITNKQTPLGYIETKDIAISLDQTERTDQMKRYLGSLANLILTDYLEFRWYVAGQHRLTARIARVGVNKKLVVDAEGIEKVAGLLQGFMVTQAPTVSSPKELATRMASLAQLIRSAIHLSFESEEGAGSLHAQMLGFRQVLLPDLTYEQFADMYAQTICYGLFAARCNCSDTPGVHFTREHAVYDIPKTNPFLRKMFGYIAGPDLDERIVWAVDDLAELLNRADMGAILKDFGRRTRQEDPVVHFYETFLAAYDPKLRELRGVYYTPEPIVSYIVRSVDYLLRKDFELPDGLADDTMLKAVSSDGKSSLQAHKVQILDPATGTGTFLHSAIDLIHESFKGNQGMWSSYVSDHLLPRLFGFELLMAPYTVAHMKIGIQLADTGYDFRGKGRLGVFLTNTLEEGFEGGKLPFVEWLVEEATAAGNVKHDFPVMVIISNPPYSNFGRMNRSEWILGLLKDYKKDLHEKKLNLDDDFIKFIRFGQWRIEQTGYGILAFITNNTYINGITHRRMRQSLMETFSDIYILDLHGSSMKKEKSPDGSKDENVFDIQQGVAIGVFVKKPRATEHANVYHSELWGLRERKYAYLSEADVKGTQWTKLEPKQPQFFFVPQMGINVEEYERGRQLTQIFPTLSSGFQTKRDAFTIHGKATDLTRVLDDILTLSVEDVRSKYDLPPDGRDWTISWAKEHIKQLHASNRLEPTSCLYRPFDSRLTIFDDKSKGFLAYPRYEVQSHMLKPNIALITTRQLSGNHFQHVFVTRQIIDGNTISLQTREYNYLFPLYLYPEQVEQGLFDTDENSNTPNSRRPNLSQAFILDISKKLNMQFIQDGKGDLQQTFGPEDVFDYMYAVFHSPMYRARYAEFLKIDFPRLPLTSNVDLFRVLCRLGKRLVALHLLEKSGTVTTSYPMPGENIVEKVEYTEVTDEPEQGRVWINRTQFFAGISSEVWQFHVGGYQVCQKWLKDRKGRVLSYQDIKHFQKIVAILSETIQLMSQIDVAIEEHGGWPIE